MANIDDEFLGSSLLNLFSRISDPRVVARCRHNLIDILVISVCAVICNAKTWEEIVEFGNERYKWFRQFLELPNGIPSHDTFLRLFAIIDAGEFEKAFFAWISTVVKLKQGQVIALDGKTVNGTGRYLCGSSAEKPLALLNVWATEDEIVVGQLKMKSTGGPELRAIKKAIKLFDIRGMVLTVDAASAHTSFTKAVLARGGDYIIPIKKSKKRFSKKMQQIFTNHGLICDQADVSSSGHGRKEKRTCMTIDINNAPLSFNKKLDGKNYWEGISTLGMIIYDRDEKDKRTVRLEKASAESWRWVPNKRGRIKTQQVRYFLSSLKINAAGLLEKVKSHWGIENKVNWSLDVTFGEDSNKTRNKRVARSSALIRKLALNLLRKEKTVKKSLKLKMKKCSWNNEYLEKVLFGSI